MAPLLNNPNDSAPWACWLSHVALVNFLLQHVYDSAIDKKKLQALVKDHLKKFEAVEEWQQYGKPKLHLVTHLEELFDDVGVFRTAWCMWGEAFVQVLKRMFEMTNFKNATTSVHTFWIYKAVQHWKDPKRATWYNDQVEPASDFSFELEDLSQHSVLLRVLLKNMTPYAVRFLRGVTRNNDEIRLNDWILLTDQHIGSQIAKVSEMAQANVLQDGVAKSFIRLWLVRCSTPLTDTAGHMTISKTADRTCMYVKYEEVQISLVSHTEHADHDAYY
jgi:hypothetical protein